MAEIIKRDDEYYVRFYGNGLLFEKYAGRDLARAEALLKEITDSLPRGAMSNVIPDQRVIDFLDECRAAVPELFGAASQTAFEAVMRAFGDFCERSLDAGKDAKLSSVTPKFVERFRDAAAAAGSSPLDTNFQLFLLRALLDRAVARGYLNDNPALHVPFLKAPRPPVMDRGDLERLRMQARGTMRLVLDFCCGESPLNDRLREVRWVDFADETLRNSFICALLEARVPLIKIHERLRVPEIDMLKPFAGVAPLPGS